MAEPRRALDWEERYRVKDVPWDKNEAAPGLVDFLAARPEWRSGTVCVPGCGLGHDARAWAKAGFTVTAFDIAPSAISAARLLAAKEGLEIDFREADFLATPCGPYDWIFEHTFFSAIHPSEREAYQRAIASATRPGSRFLAIYFLIEDDGEPPFGTTRRELMERFQPLFDLELEWLPRSWPNRSGEERMFLWRRR